MIRMPEALASAAMPQIIPAEKADMANIVL